VVAAAVLIFKYKKTEPIPISIDCSTFMSLKEKYPNQDKMLFKSLKSGVEGIYNRKPIVPSVFTLFSTDEKLIQSIMNEIIVTTKECINQDNNPISLTPDDLNTESFINDNTKIIGEYKQKLNESTILLLNNIDRVSTLVLPALHSFADTYNPLVSRSILFFTITVPERPPGKPVEYINDYLKNKWKDLEENFRNPLITRILDQTFFIEKN
jgi:hypothetical protein